VEEFALLPESCSTSWSRRLYSSVVSVRGIEAASWIARFEVAGCWAAQTGGKIDVVNIISSRKRRAQRLPDAIIA
jgi:hypothetical protein